MSRPLGLLFALCLLTLLAAPTAIRAAATPRVEVKTGLRVVATIYYSPARPGDKGFERRAGGLAVKIFPQKGGKAVAEVKTDDKGVFVVPSGRQVPCRGRGLRGHPRSPTGKEGVREGEGGRGVGSQVEVHLCQAVRPLLYLPDERASLAFSATTRARVED